MKSLIALLLVFALANCENHFVVLSNDYITMDGQVVNSLSSNLKGEQNLVIDTPGTYTLSGAMSGQVTVTVGSDEEVTLLLNGIDLTYTSGPAILFTKAREIDTNTYSRTNPISYAKAESLDFTNAGAKIVIADDSVNKINGGYTSSYDGAVHSKVSMLVTGETKGNGQLTIVATYEGLDSEKHLQVSGGVINIAAQNDGSNVNVDNTSVFKLTGGKLLVNAGLGKEGDGIDSNGYLIIDGGEVISASSPNADSGLDSNLGLIVNGGKVIGVGSTMDMAEDTGSQPTMNLCFSSSVSGTSTLTVKDNSGNTLVSFSPSTAGFVSGTSYRTYTGAVVSSPDFKLNTVYHLYLDGTQVGYTSNDKCSPFPPHSSFGGRNGKNNNSVSATMKTDFTMTKNAVYFSNIAKA